MGNRGPALKPEVRRGRAALAWLMNCVDKETGESNWWKLWATLLARSLNGDTKAARLILDYALGAPRQTIDLETHEHIDSIPRITPDMDLRTMMSIYSRTLDAVGTPGDGGHLDARLGNLPPPMPILDIDAACENYRRVSYPDGEDEDYDNGKTAKSVSLPRVRRGAASGAKESDPQRESPGRGQILRGMRCQ
jgi:hypothetical protein